MARISSRSAGSSDATPQIAAAMAVDEHQFDGMHRIDTTRPVGESAAEALEICCLAT
jgi:predicted kinase